MRAPEPGPGGALVQTHSKILNAGAVSLITSVLIVDDSRFMRTMLKEICLSEPFGRVYEAANGIEAIDQYRRFHPDMVMMDITMPVMDGLEALKALRVLHCEVRILMVSAMGQQALLQEAIDYGAAGFVVKPFEAAKVLQEIRHVLARHPVG